MARFEILARILSLAAILGLMLGLVVLAFAKSRELYGTGSTDGDQHVNCPSCGAPTPVEADACTHCGEPMPQ